MRFLVFFSIFSLFCMPIFSTERARISFGGRSSQAHLRMQPKNVKAPSDQSEQKTDDKKQQKAEKITEQKPIEENKSDNKEGEPLTSSNCRDEYRKCMDEFCLLDESEGERCACSDNINSSKSLIKEIQTIQEEADKLFTEEVEKVKLGAKVKFVFGKSDKAKKVNIVSWLNEDYENSGEVGEDADIGDTLYETANNFCKPKLKSCEKEAEMEEALYSRNIIKDCKTFSNYLSEQKTNVIQNKRIAEQAVRKAKLEMVDITNKYNRGECLLAYKACIANKGGCGAKFENCLDESLLSRRANACENVLEQCMAERKNVLSDWQEESELILAEALKYADQNKRATCFAKIQTCLEDGCSTSTNSACLTDVNIASNVCPIIEECNTIIPGIKTSVSDKLHFLRARFCQNDIDKCLQDKCGVNYNKPECIGKKSSEIVAMCPQNMFPSCKGENQFNILVQATLLQMDYQRMQGCINYFSDKLGKVCGMDMNCLPPNDTIASLNKLPKGEEKLLELREKIRTSVKQSVDEFFTKFQKETTVSSCIGPEQPKGQSGLGENVFLTAKMIAEISAENRAMRELDSKISELTRKLDLDEAKEACLTTYKVSKEEVGNNSTAIKSVSFEPSLRNCHVCRLQKVCETGGESKAAGFLKAAGGGLAAGSALGSQVSPGWGSAIGGAVGLVGAGIMGAIASGEKEFCQTIESCEDINM